MCRSEVWFLQNRTTICGKETFWQSKIQKRKQKKTINTDLRSSSGSGIKVTRVSKTSLLIFVALTAKFWQLNNHRTRQELTMNQSKNYTFQNLKGLVFSSPDRRSYSSFQAQIYTYNSQELWSCSNSWQ